VPPTITIIDGEIHFACTADYLRTFASERNVGDRLMVGAVIDGAYSVTGVSLAPEEREALLGKIVRSDKERFFHTIPTTSPRERVFAVVREGRPRFVQPEDRAIGWLNLADEAGWTDPAGDVPLDRAGKLLNDASNVAWQRIKARLLTLERGSVVERSIRNDFAVFSDRATWQLTAAAVLSLYDDQADVISAANQREGQRGIAALASRVIAEMAICVSPVGAGAVCSAAELDYLIANVSILLECAGQSDALHFGLMARPPVVQKNGALTFDTNFMETLHQPYMFSHGERAFRAAAADYGSPFETHDGERKPINPEYLAAFVDEFRLAPGQLFAFTYQLADMAVERRESTFRLRRSEILAELVKAKAEHPERAYDAFSLKPRAAWDEQKPVGAKKRDWYPWRFNRRLSLTRRPMVQIDTTDDPVVVIAPALIDRSVEYLFGTYEGRFPGDLFTGDLMKKWIGGAVNAGGHAFNHTIADAYKELGFEARADVNMTELGGTKALGDIDALAWHAESGTVYATECKRLLFDRTIGEIGERLREYTSVAGPGEDRTPYEKHRDRMAFLQNALPALSKVTGIPVDKIKLRSALVTDYLVPMQFSKEALQLLDVVTDLSLLGTAVGDHSKKE
jgi:hypothetical protein